MEKLQKEMEEKKSNLKQIAQNNQEQKETESKKFLENELYKLESELQNKKNEHQK